MGSWLSSFASPTLAIPVKESDLKNGDEVAIKQFRNDLRNLGFAILEMPDSFYQITQDYRAECGKWFKENSFAEKKKYTAESKDELFRELGRAPNIGYILTEHKKEYLKLCHVPDSNTHTHTHILSLSDSRTVHRKICFHRDQFIQNSSSYTKFGTTLQ